MKYDIGTAGYGNNSSHCRNYTLTIEHEESVTATPGPLQPLEITDASFLTFMVELRRSSHNSYDIWLLWHRS